MSVGRIIGEIPQQSGERISKIPESESHNDSTKGSASGSLNPSHDTTIKNLERLWDRVTGKNDEIKAIQASAGIVAERGGRVFVSQFDRENAGYCMGPPTHPVLQQIYHLDRSSSDFHSQLNHALRTREYRQITLELRANDLIWFVDYLDNVRCHITSSYPALNQT